MSKKLLLASLLDRFKILELLKENNRHSLIVINYHRIYDGVLSTEFDEGVFGPSVEEFECQMRWLKSNYEILSENDMIDFAEKKLPINKKYIAVTFDDAYSDNYKLAFPVLKALNIPAIYFVPTGIIMSGRLGWWDIISFLIKRCSRAEININGKQIALGGDDRKKEAIDYMLNHFKSVEHSKTANLLEDLSHQCEVPFPTDEEQRREVMTWEQIKEVQSHNIAIGAHTHSHRVLSSLELDEQRIELEKSKKILEENLNCKIQSLAYPVGGKSHFSENTKQFARESGFRIAFSYYSDINCDFISDPFDIKRISLSPELTACKATLVMPTLFVRIPTLLRR